MAINALKIKELEDLCLGFRRSLIETLHAIQTGHPGGSLSVCEILTSIYFAMGNISPQNAKDRNRDKVVLCKGHAAPMLYLELAEKGFFPKEDFKNLRQSGCHLQGHPCPLHTPGIEVATGPLGAGYPAALGSALSDVADGIDAYTYAILGDGEINEGVIWETCLNAAKFKADHLIAILDWNKVQLDGTTADIMPTGSLEEKFRAFGYYTITVDGHDILSLCRAITEAKLHKGNPVIILAHTIKGKGISFMEGKNEWHGKAISDEDYQKAMDELGGKQI